ncbi:MAG: hypothetical protein ABI790_05155 [Betaproteobacteria bacterium]
MIMKLARLGLVLLIGLAGSAHATFHLWRITEIYSNADGSVQFIELTALAGGQQFLAGHQITSLQGAQSKSFTFPTNLPGDSAEVTGAGYYGPETNTDYKSFLIGTQGFAALNGVRPDYIVPNGFLFTANGTVNFADADIVSYTSLPTAGGLSIDANGTTAVNSPKNFAGNTGSVVAAAGPLNYSDMWWAGLPENGWGMSIQQHGNVQFVAIYVYDGTGKPTWYVMPGGTWNASFTSYTGLLYQPVSAPLNDYSPAQFLVGASPGSITLNFTSNSTATMQYTINGVTGQKALTRQDFGSGNSPLSVGDMWWAGSAQDGWGINLVQHAGIVFGVWYTYGTDGKPTWFVLPTGTWAGNTYAGTLYSTTGSAWLGAAYNPAQLSVTEAGTLAFNFTNANNATMNYTFISGPFAGTIQTKSIFRQPY